MFTLCYLTFQGLHYQKGFFATLSPRRVTLPNPGSAKEPAREFDVPPPLCGEGARSPYKTVACHPTGSGRMPTFQGRQSTWGFIVPSFPLVLISPSLVMGMGRGITMDYEDKDPQDPAGSASGNPASPVGQGHPVGAPSGTPTQPQGQGARPKVKVKVNPQERPLGLLLSPKVKEHGPK